MNYQPATGKFAAIRLCSVVGCLHPAEHTYTTCPIPAHRFPMSKDALAAVREVSCRFYDGEASKALKQACKFKQFPSYPYDMNDFIDVNLWDFLEARKVWKQNQKFAYILTPRSSRQINAMWAVKLLRAVAWQTWDVPALQVGPPIPATDDEGSILPAVHYDSRPTAIKWKLSVAWERKEQPELTGEESRKDVTDCGGFAFRKRRNKKPKPTIEEIIAGFFITIPAPEVPECKVWKNPLRFTTGYDSVLGKGYQKRKSPRKRKVTRKEKRIWQRQPYQRRESWAEFVWKQALKYTPTPKPEPKKQAWCLTLEESRASVVSGNGMEDWEKQSREKV